MMQFIGELQKNVRKLDSVYDLAAFCYDYLIGCVRNQAQFLGKYIMCNESAESGNPNLQKLWQFSCEIEQILQKREEEGWSFSRCLEELQQCAGKITLKKYGSALFNDAAIPFFILLSIDRYVLGKKGRLSKREPLNEGYCEKSYLYLRIEKNMMDEAADANDFSDVILGATIRNQMKHLIFLEKKDWPDDKMAPPQIRQLWILEEDGERRRILAEKKLNIAVIPFGNEDMLRFPVDEGALFHVEYTKWHQRNAIPRAIKLLDEAIDQKANIILFPEFVCSRETQEAMGEHLRKVHESHPDRVSSLLFVVAGSGWTKDNDNVCKIFSYSGQFIGNQYKICQFCDWRHEGKAMMENLRHPGKETTMIAIDGLGKVLIGICRDISNREYTRDLARFFAPQLLLVPAWSKSVQNGFRQQFMEITAENHVSCSVLCNCCEALCKREKAGDCDCAGIACAPYKEKTVVIGKVQEIQRKCRCRRTKCRKGGCVIMIHMDFLPDVVRQGGIISRIS